MNERKLREQGYIRIDKFCSAMDTWAEVRQQELPGDREYRPQWRRDFREHWAFIQLAILKSCLLDRLIYVTTVVATVLKDNILYVLELNDAPGFPGPGNGKVVRMIGTTIKTIATGLTVPTGMTLGPDGNLYVSNFGALPAPAAGQGLGQVVKITLP